MVWTYDVGDDTDTLGTRGRPVARHDALHADLLRSAEDLSLLADDSGVHGADEDVDASQVLLELLEVVVQVADADLDARGAERDYFVFVSGGGADERSDALGGAEMRVSGGRDYTAGVVG